MARLRYNGLATGSAGSTVALTLGASLTNSATSVTFSAALTHSNGTAVPTIAGADYIPLSILDANGHVSEVVWLTAYTAAATTGTIVRGKEGTSGVAHSSGDKIVCSMLVRDLTEAFPSGAAESQPSPANAKDDEFDGTSSVTWTSTPTAPNAWDINTTRPGHAYLKASGSSAVYVGKYQAVPGSYPYTITTKLTASTARGNYHRGGGVFIAPASPTNSSSAYWVGQVFDTGNGNRYAARFLTTLGGTLSTLSTIRLQNWWGGVYSKIVVNSATSVDTFVSIDGYAWLPLDTAANPGFTPGVMGVAATEESAGGGVEAFFDYFRVS